MAALHDAWLTPAEAAKELRISVNTLYSLLNNDRMAGQVRIGHQWRISRRALDETALRPVAAVGVSGVEAPR
jgi:excisionase family DNA binding protein